MSETNLNVIAVNVGNTRSAVASFSGRKLESAERFANKEPDRIGDRVIRYVEDAGADEHDPACVVVASVNDKVARALGERLKKRDDARVLRIGRDLAIPIGRQLDPEALVGDDRLLNAAAAFDMLKQACVVIDAGTAVTVDFVDGQGTFHGGAIAPGCQLQLDSLHGRTAQLPDVAFVSPDPDPFGPNTRQAMLHGVYYGVRGMVRHLIERYAEAYQAYPAIVATGGDAHTLFDDDEFIERIDDELTLRGIVTAYLLALEHAESADNNRDESDLDA